MAKYAAKGTQLQVSDGLPSPTFTSVANLTTISGPGGDTEEIDVTTHDAASNFREFLASFKDPGEISFEGFYDPEDTTHEELTTLYTSGDERDWKIVLPAGAGTGMEIAFAGYVRNVTLDNPFDGAGSITGSIRVTGAITFPVAP